MKTALAFATLSLALCLASTAQAVTIETVPVGNAGNAGEIQSFGTFGAVDYNYRIGKYEVTNAQYTEFLNAADPMGLNHLQLYSNEMSIVPWGGIDFDDTAAPGFKYEIEVNYGSRPVNFVSWYDAIRFANWLHNGQGNGDTESGAYTLLGGTPTPSNGDIITRNPGATWFLPNADEWYKAAYHQNDGVTGNYVAYPDAGDGGPPTKLEANYDFAHGHPIEVGSYPHWTSPYGTYDQGGNVREWTEYLPVDSNLFYRAAPGGGWGDAHQSLGSTLFQDGAHAFNEYNTYGFRVATIPEPNTFTLAVLGLAGLTYRRLKRT